ncbi:MAG: peptidylprolyl isomerase [Pseudomonadota bacterium]
MLHPIKSLLVAACTSLVLAQGALAQDEPDPNQVLATVNGTEITLGHVIALRAELPAQYNQFPSALLFRGIIDQLIQHTLLMQSLEGEPTLRSRISIENETRAVLAGQVMNKVLSSETSQDRLQALYDEIYPADTQETEYRAAHILVESEDEAKAILAELEDGAEFAALARERSTGPSGSAGGDLGWFGDGDMVADFFVAVTQLEQGEVSPPVQTEFGWHVIQLAETRNKERPAFETVQAELEEQLRQSIIESHIADLESKAEINQTEIEDMDPEVITNFELLEN